MVSWHEGHTTHHPPCQNSCSLFRKPLQPIGNWVMGKLEEEQEGEQSADRRKRDTVAYFFKNSFSTTKIILPFVLPKNSFWNLTIISLLSKQQGLSRYIFPFFPGSRDASDIIVIKKNIFINNILLTVLNIICS